MHFSVESLVDEIIGINGNANKEEISVEAALFAAEEYGHNIATMEMLMAIGNRDFHGTEAMEDIVGWFMKFGNWVNNIMTNIFSTLSNFLIKLDHHLYNFGDKIDMFVDKLFGNKTAIATLKEFLKEEITNNKIIGGFMIEIYMGALKDVKVTLNGTLEKFRKISHSSDIKPVISKLQSEYAVLEATFRTISYAKTGAETGQYRASYSWFMSMMRFDKEMGRIPSTISKMRESFTKEDVEQISTTMKDILSTKVEISGGNEAQVREATVAIKNVVEMCKKITDKSKEVQEILIKDMNKVIELVSKWSQKENESFRK